ncbi:MAG: ABC transporter substrate-binding protein [Candidatus Wallbacteria bacterium]|nr:ABC transporter substrate-binding protein [Candidatus Wallbacteria bacterium]
MPKRKITLGHSPDPDDAFMFYPLAKGLVDSGPYEFEHILQDIETLNRRATRSELDVTALSLHAYAHVADRYALMHCGASMGDGYGPLVVAREPMTLAELRGKTVAVPGTMTTAYLALRLCMGEFPYTVVAFDEILREVAQGRADAGLIIHEGQLTYGDLGLCKVVDLGEWWRDQTGLPLPLGANGIRRDFPPAEAVAIAGIVHASIAHALEHRKDALAHALNWARDMDLERADRFVSMYVNDYTLDFGEKGRRAVTELLARAAGAGIVPGRPPVQFV